MTVGQGFGSLTIEVDTPRNEPEGANRRSGWSLPHHGRETKAFPRWRTAAAGSPTYSRTPRRCVAGRRSRAAPRCRARAGTARRRGSRGRRAGGRSSAPGTAAPGPVIFPGDGPDRLQARDQHGGGIPLGPGDGVRAMMHPVDQLDAGVPRWPGQRRVEGRAPRAMGARGRGGRSTPRSRRAARPAHGRRPGERRRRRVADKPPEMAYRRPGRTKPRISEVARDGDRSPPRTTATSSRPSRRPNDLDNGPRLPPGRPSWPTAGRRPVPPPGGTSLDDRRDHGRPAEASAGAVLANRPGALHRRGGGGLPGAGCCGTCEVGSSSSGTAGPTARGR